MFNARSLRNKFHDLSFLLDSHRFDLIFFTETWLDERIPDNFLTRDSKYLLFRHDRGRLGGGTAIFVKHCYKCSLVDIPSTFSNLEVVGIDLFLSSSSKYRIFCIYFPPSSAIVPYEIKMLCKFLNFGCSTNFTSIFIGDFNFSSINWSDLSASGYASIFLQECLKLNLNQLVKEPTRASNILDLVLTNHPYNVNSVSICVPFSSTCDHNGVYFSLAGSLLPKPKPIQVPNFFKADYSAISAIIRSIDWQAFYQYSNFNVETFWHFFCHVLNNIISNPSLVPLKWTKQRLTYPKYLRRLQQKKRQIYRKYHRDPSFFYAYKAICAKFSENVKQYICNYENDIVRNPNDKVFFSYLRQKLNSRPDIPSIKDDNGNLIHDSTDKAEFFNQYFKSILIDDDGNLPHLASYTTTLPGLSDVEFPTATIIQKLCQLKAKSCFTPDGFPPIFLRNLSYDLAIPLQIIFENSFRCGFIPNEWKTSVILPFHKKGNRSFVNNYRPIALTSILCKTMENIIADKLTSYLHSNNLISKVQHGFIKNRSPCTQLLNILNEWSLGINHRSQINVVYIDYAKAFDKICHRKLLKLLTNIGIGYELLFWLENFICDRSQCVRIDNSFSSIAPVSSGVPQGSVLGPYLFLIYINDVTSCLSGTCKMALFADDLKIYEVNRTGDFISLQNTLNNIQNWSSTMQLTISLDKTKASSYGQNISEQSFQLNNVVIDRVTKFSDIGVLFSSNLKFSDHCRKISGTAMSRAYLILKSFVTNDPFVLMKAFKSYVRPLTEYCTPVWSPYLHQDITIIEKVQRYFTKKICNRANISYNDYFDRLKSLNVQSLEARRIMFDLILVFKMFKGFVDLSINDFFSPRPVNRGHPFQLRPMYRPLCNVTQYFFSYRVFSVWNSLPEHFVFSSSVKEFKRHLLSYDLSPFCKVYVRSGYP